MPTTPLWNDGTVQFGTFGPGTMQLFDTVGNAYESYVVESVTLSRPTQEILRRQQEGKPSGSAGIEDFVRGTLTGIQLSSGNTKAPINGYTFTVTLESGSNAVSGTYILKNPVLTQQQAAENKYNAEFLKKYN